MFRGGRTARTIIFLVVGFLVIGLSMLGAIVRHFTMPARSNRADGLPAGRAADVLHREPDRRRRGELRSR